MRAVRQAFFILLLGLTAVFAAFAPVAASAAPAADLPALLASTLNIQSPASCPAGGCAAGQRLNVRLNFAVNDPLYVDGSPNIKVCLYAPTGWGVSPTGVEYSSNGGSSSIPYTLVNDCKVVASYTAIAQLQAVMTNKIPTDFLDFAFRLGLNAPGGQPETQFVAYVFQRTDATTWANSNNPSSAIIKVVAAATPSFVANDGNACGSNSPCYINSGDDKDKGIGTGLKDAVDAVPAGGTVILFGNYTVKSKTVLVDHPLTLTGDVTANLTYSGPTSGCQNPLPLLSLNEQILVTGLAINDGVCNPPPGTSNPPNRTLLQINTDQDVTIESSSLTGGENAIEINDLGGDITIRYNAITGNAGYAVFWKTGSAPLPGAMNLVANNLHNNPTYDSPVTCEFNGSTVHANRLANHNYWGGPAPSAADTNCFINPGKELGARILPRTNAPGVSAYLVVISDTEKHSAFDGQMSYQQSGAGSFPIYLVDHGYGSPDGLPFAWENMTSPLPCGNFFDVFFPDGQTPTNVTLDLFFKYNHTTTCDTVISSAQYCNQTTATKYPLFWYDPLGDVTEGWDTTGQLPAGTAAGDATGQTTTCNITDHEIKLSIDTSGRPGLSTDLNFTPFYAGVPVINSFLPLALNNKVDVTWKTNNEPEIKGFYVLYGTDPTDLNIHSELILPKGTGLTGATYSSLTDSTLLNNTSYYFQVKVVRTDGYEFYTEIKGTKPNIPTITPTLTVTTIPTKTRIIPSNTPIPTLYPQQSPSRVPSQTRTPTNTPVGGTSTPVPFLTRTPDLSATITPQVTATSSTPADSSGYPPETMTPGGTEIAMLSSATPSPETTLTPAVAGAATGGDSWWSLVLGLLAGTAVVFGGGYLYMKSREG